MARRIYELAAIHGKRVQAQGGAKNHLVVLPDANLDAAIPNLMGSTFGCAGQRCLAGIGGGGGERCLLGVSPTA